MSGDCGAIPFTSTAKHRPQLGNLLVDPDLLSLEAVDGCEYDALTQFSYHVTCRASIRKIDCSAFSPMLHRASTEERLR
jgi:hypothetical protein